LVPLEDEADEEAEVEDEVEVEDVDEEVGLGGSGLEQATQARGKMERGTRSDLRKGERRICPASHQGRAGINTPLGMPQRRDRFEAVIDGHSEQARPQGRVGRWPVMALLQSRAMEPTWKRLVEQLRAEGHKSPYLDRLKQRLPASGLADVAAEILREMASALGRSEDKVNVALLELEVMGKKLDALAARKDADPEERAARVAAFNQQREAAATALWELRVHREALGFRRNEDLAELYPIPPRRRA
jgi:hypothetical protein